MCVSCQLIPWEVAAVVGTHWRPLDLLVVFRVCGFASVGAVEIFCESMPGPVRLVCSRVGAWHCCAPFGFVHLWFARSIRTSNRTLLLSFAFVVMSWMHTCRPKVHKRVLREVWGHRANNPWHLPLSAPFLFLHPLHGESVQDGGGICADRAAPVVARLRLSQAHRIARTAERDAEIMEKLEELVMKKRDRERLRLVKLLTGRGLATKFRGPAAVITAFL